MSSHHPLDPLSKEEIHEAAAVLRAKAELDGIINTIRFNVITLKVGKKDS
jgi:Cu2+-containing amine oxidase